MKFLSLMSFILLLVSPAHASPPDMIDYLSTIPAKVTGRMELASDWKAFEEKTPLVLGLKKHVVFKVRKNAPIKYEFNESTLLIQSAGALELSINGIKVNVTAIGYDSKKKDFFVNTKIIHGISSPIIEDRIKKVLKEKFTAKLDRAAAVMTKMRSKRKLGDAQKLLMTVVDIFKEGAAANTPPIPNITGAVSLTLKIPANQTVIAGESRADFKKGQIVDVSMDFRKIRDKFKVDGIKFYANDGINFRRPKSKNPKDFVKATIKGISLTRTSGFQVDGTNSGDELMSQVATIFNLLAQAASRNQRRDLNCDDDVTLFHTLLDRKLSGSVKEYIRSHRASLLEAGLSSELLYALETDNSNALNYLDFLPVD